jgi:hypothetical protein
MKALPKRKGNVEPPQRKIRAVHASMKAPPKRKGEDSQGFFFGECTRPQ